MYRFIALSLFVTIAAASPLETIESDVYEASGSQAELITRAQACIAQHVRFDAVSITGSGDDSFAAINPYRPNNAAQQVPGGDVIVAITPDSVIANSRTDFKAFMSRHSVQSTLTLLAKDGRFKIRHSAIRSLSYDSGLIENEGYRPIKEGAPFAKNIRAALGALSAKIANCMTTPAADDW